MIHDSNIIGVVDVNNCFASIERVFRPDLRSVPVAVLSNNDGVVIARSQELKRLGVGAGEPYFKSKEMMEWLGVKIFSSNFTLYHDMTQRIFYKLRTLVDDIEIYSIDEAFIMLTGHLDPYSKGEEIRSVILKTTKIPVSVGLGPTKTLAKMASHIAKSNSTHTKINEGVFEVNSRNIEECLSKFPVEELWGVGRRYAKFLRLNKINSALDLVNKPTGWIRKYLTIKGLCMVDELQGIQRVPFHTNREAKKTILSSRSFGKSTTDIKVLRESISFHADYVSKKLRKQNSLASELTVFIRTNMHNKDAKYIGYTNARLIDPTSFTPTLTKAALQGLEKIYKPKYKYWKAGVAVNNLIQENPTQLNIFKQVPNKKQGQIMQSYDFINLKYGSGTIKLSTQTLKSKTEQWSMKRDLLSPSYTTRWEDIPRVH